MDNSLELIQTTTPIKAWHPMLSKTSIMLQSTIYCAMVVCSVKLTKLQGAAFPRSPYGQSLPEILISTAPRLDFASASPTESERIRRHRTLHPRGECHPWSNDSRVARQQHEPRPPLPRTPQTPLHAATTKKARDTTIPGVWRRGRQARRYTLRRPIVEPCHFFVFVFCFSQKVYVLKQL